MTYFSTPNKIPKDKIKSHPTSFPTFNHYRCKCTTPWSCQWDWAVWAQKCHITLKTHNTNSRKVSSPLCLWSCVFTHADTWHVRLPELLTNTQRSYNERYGECVRETRLYYYIDCAFKPASLQLVYLRKAGRALGPLGPPSQQQIEWLFYLQSYANALGRSRTRSVHTSALNNPITLTKMNTHNRQTD